LVDGKGNLFINFHIRGQNNKVAAFIKNNAPVESGLDEDKDTRSFTTLQEGPDGRIFCSGYYVEKDSILPHAIVMAEISPESGKLVTLKRSNINDRMAKELAPHDEPIFFGSGGFDRYNVHTALIDNSGLYLAFEHNISVPKRSGNVDWSYVDCLQIGMVKLDFDGRIAWQSIIPRWLRESYSGSGSIGLALRNDNCYIFYNDRASNAEVKNLKEMKYAYPDVNKQYAIVRKDQMGALVCARIDADGEVKRKVIDEYKEPVIVHANENIQLDDDRVLLGTYFSDKRNVQHIFSKLTLVTMQGER